MRLPKNSKIVGKKEITNPDMVIKDPLQVIVYRYIPEEKKNPWMAYFNVDASKCGSMVLDVLMHIKNHIDPTLSFRKSCREGICGSCAMNINGRNRLACLTCVSDLKGTVKISPLPHMPVVRDLVTDLSDFYAQYAETRPWIENNSSSSEDTENLQSVEDREKLDGLYECILCACCSTSCPSYWWNSDKYIGPAALLQVYRWVADSRDQDTANRLDRINDKFALYRCHNIMQCVDSCPKNLNPSQAIGNLKKKLVEKHIS